MKQGWQVAGRIKASGGCENLKAQADGLWKARHQEPLPPAGKTLEGTKPQERRLMPAPAGTRVRCLGGAFDESAPGLVCP